MSRLALSHPEDRQQQPRNRRRTRHGRPQAPVALLLRRTEGSGSGTPTAAALSTGPTTATATTGASDEDQLGMTACGLFTWSFPGLTWTRKLPAVGSYVYLVYLACNFFGPTSLRCPQKKRVGAARALRVPLARVMWAALLLGQGAGCRRAARARRGSRCWRCTYTVCEASGQCAQAVLA